MNAKAWVDLDWATRCWRSNPMSEGSGSSPVAAVAAHGARYSKCESELKENISIVREELFLDHPFEQLQI